MARFAPPSTLPALAALTLALAPGCATGPDPALALLRRVSTEARREAKHQGEKLTALADRLEGLEDSLAETEKAIHLEQEKLAGLVKAATVREERLQGEVGGLATSLAKLRQGQDRLERGLEVIRRTVLDRGEPADRIALLERNLTGLLEQDRRALRKRLDELARQETARPDPAAVLAPLLARLDRLEARMGELADATRGTAPPAGTTPGATPTPDRGWGADPLETPTWPWLAGGGGALLLFLLWALRSGRRRPRPAPVDAAPSRPRPRPDRAAPAPPASIDSGIRQTSTAPAAVATEAAEDAPPRRVMVDLEAPPGGDEGELGRAAADLLARSPLVLVEPGPEQVPRPGGRGVRLFFHLPGFATPAAREELLERLHRLERRREAP